MKKKTFIFKTYYRKHFIVIVSTEKCGGAGSRACVLCGDEYVPNGCC